MATPPPKRPSDDRKPRPRLPVIDDAPSATPKPSGSGRLRVENFDDTGPGPLHPHAADAGAPVNKASRAVNPRKQYPVHFDHLMRDLFNRGETPEQWQIIAADEVRLDEMNMDIEFTLTNTKTNAVVRRCVEMQAGKLARIRDR